jgi:hypothetical protein
VLAGAGVTRAPPRDAKLGFSQEEKGLPVAVASSYQPRYAPRIVPEGTFIAADAPLPPRDPIRGRHNEMHNSNPRIIKGKAQAEAQQAIAKTLTKEYLQYKAFDGSATRYYFLPTGKDGLPVFINTPGK